jgi:hypothetical protein
MMKAGILLNLLIGSVKRFRRTSREDDRLPVDPGQGRQVLGTLQPAFKVQALIIFTTLVLWQTGH